MGVSGSGKTTVGHLLASQLGWQFADADDYHSAANIDKMRNGIPLTDTDREPWLETLHDQIATWLAEGKSAILACSALKQSYRDRLRVSPEVKVVYLKGAPQLLRKRLHARAGHYMRESMLASQLATLEEPGADAADKALVINIDTGIDMAASPAEITSAIRRGLGLRS